MKTPSIGILGGAGAIASARFHLDLVQEWARTHEAKTDDDFPQIIHLSRSLGLSAEGLSNLPRSTRALMDMEEDFDECEWIAVVCNSIVPLLPHPLPKQMLTPVAACREALKGVKSAWLLASASTIRDEVYQRAYPHIDWQVPNQSLTPWIQNAIGVTPGTFDHTTLIDGLGIPEHTTVVLGCTELSTQKRRTDCWHRLISPTDQMIRILCKLSTL